MTMHRILPIAAGALAAVALTACSGSSGGPLIVTKSSQPTTSATSTAPSTTAPAVQSDPNEAVCTQAYAVILKIQKTLNSWNPDTNEFDQNIADALRSEATHLYAVAAKATGGTASALRDEAAGMVGISVAIESMDDAALAGAATDANKSLAAVRGVCGF